MDKERHYYILSFTDENSDILITDAESEVVSALFSNRNSVSDAYDGTVTDYLHDELKQLGYFADYVGNVPTFENN